MINFKVLKKFQGESGNSNYTIRTILNNKLEMYYI